MGLFEYLFTKCVQTSAGQAGPNFKTVRQRVWKNNSRVLRRSEYFKSDNSSKQASKCDNILDTGGVLDPCNPIVFWVPIFDCYCCCKYTAASMWMYICAICTVASLGTAAAAGGQILLSKQFPHEKCIIRRKIKLLRCELHWIHVRNSECKQDFFVKMHTSSTTNTANAN